MHSSRMRTARTAPGDVPGPGGCTCPGDLPVGCTWSWGVYLVMGVYLVLRVYLVRGDLPRGVPGPEGGVPGPGYLPRGCTWSGGVPGPRGCTWSGGCTWSQGCTCLWGCTCPGTPPVNRMTNRCKNITLP